MPTMGRKRSRDDGLEKYVYLNHGAYFYGPPGRPWERLGTNKDEANAKARALRATAMAAGSMVYWLEQFLADCAERVKAGQLAQRTLDDYQGAVGTEQDPGPLRVYLNPPGARPLTPYDITPDVVQDYLDAGQAAKRSRRSNLERAALSACFGWLLRKKHCPGLAVNPCLRASGIQRNAEPARDRYVAADERRDVWAKAQPQVQLMMELAYRTLQRPDSDIIRWTTRLIVSRPTGRTLEFVQAKTGVRMTIAVTGTLDELLPKPVGGVVRPLHEPLVRRLDGKPYTYSGLSSMLKRAIKAANVDRAKAGRPLIESFGFRDLKGAGATDMWRDGVAIERIQELCGHANKTTTERYVKQRWREVVQPNSLPFLA